MNVAALALVLLAGQSLDFYEDEVPSKASSLQDMRFGLGGASIATLDGVGTAFEVGLEFVPWGPVALRLNVGGNLRYEWANVFFAPEAVFRLLPVQSTFSPYLALGASVAWINISNKALGVDPLMKPVQQPATDEGGARPPLEGSGSQPGTPIEISLGPQVAAGVRFHTFGRVALDLGARYTLLRFKGDTYNQVGVILTVCAPAS